MADGTGGRNVARKLIASHLVSGETTPGTEIGIRVDQTLTQDATGTMVMLELEALDLDRVRTDVSVQYVDHNLLQADERNMADHIFLRSAARRYGLWYSKPGNGVSHPTHMQRFGVPGATMVGSDSHTCAAGSLGMLAIGVGGLEVAMAMAGEPLHVTMPEIWGVRLTGEPPPWVSAKDVILEMLRRHGVRGGVNRIIEYHGPGLASLTAMDRHVIANMGAELGATTTVFPSDERVLEFLRAEGREDDFTEIAADPGASYDVTEEIDLSGLEPLIARPGSPGDVVPVRDVAGEEVHQVVVGSSANPGLRDFASVAAIVRGRQVHPRVSLDVNPTSRQILVDLTRMGATADLVQAPPPRAAARPGPRVRADPLAEPRQLRDPAPRVRRRGRLRPCRAGGRAARGEHPGRFEGRSRDRCPQRHQGRDLPGAAPPVRPPAGPGRRRWPDPPPPRTPGPVTAAGCAPLSTCAPRGRSRVPRRRPRCSRTRVSAACAARPRPRRGRRPRPRAGSARSGGPGTGPR
ncbi:aconitase family protein [Actinomadura chokoriensis]|uniref:aconitase family protein n=1 Tax=Actinomadura chokoriensis TaxID=454156 RepID=UPI003FCC9C05